MGFVLPGAGSGGAVGDGKTFTSDDLVNLVIQSLVTVAGTEEVILRTEDGLRIATPKQILMQTLLQYPTALTGDEQVMIRTPDGPSWTALSTLKTFVALDPKNIRSKMRILKRLTGNSTVIGADQWMWTSSGTTNKTAILQIVKDNFLSAAEAYKAVPEHILVDVAAVSGGSGAAYGGTACQGGIPGIVRQRSFWLSELTDADIPYVVGSGGVPGSGSGASYFGQAGGPSHVFASGVQRGGNDAAEHTLYFELAIAYGLDPSTARVHLLPYNNTYASDVDRPSALRGPGGGGAAFSSRGRGGHGSVGSISNAGSTGAAPTDVNKSGAAGNLKYFDSMGGGGSGRGAGVGGGNGGVPGGGGGSNASGDSTSAGYGFGGAGAVKLRFNLLEHYLA